MKAERDYCDECGRLVPTCQLLPVLVAARTHWSPAEYDQVCAGCRGDVRDDEDDAYERAAARARSNDFEETGGKDWT